MLFKKEWEIRVNIGQLLQGVVKSVDKTRKVVYLSSDADMVSKCVELKGISIDPHSGHDG